MRPRTAAQSPYDIVPGSVQRTPASAITSQNCSMLRLCHGSPLRPSHDVVDKVNFNTFQNNEHARHLGVRSSIFIIILMGVRSEGFTNDPEPYGSFQS